MPDNYEKTSNWLGLKLLSSDTFSKNNFSGSFLMNLKNIQQLEKSIRDPQWGDLLFGKPLEWVQTLMFFPLKLDFGTINPDFSLVVGGHLSSAGARYPNIDNYYYLGEYYYKVLNPTFKDFTGYTEIKVYLPFYGYVDISPNDVINKYIQFRLKVDIKTGQGIYYIGVSDTSIYLENCHPVPPNFDANVRILQKYACQLGYSIPLNNSSTIDTIRNIMAGAVKVGGTLMLASGFEGDSIKSTTMAVTNVDKEVLRKQKNKKTNRLVTAGKTITKGTTTHSSTREVSGFSGYVKYRIGSSVIGDSVQALANAHVDVSSDKVSNSILDMNGPLHIKVVIKKPKYIEQGNDFNHIYGKPLGAVKRLGDLHGYTEPVEFHLEDDGFNKATREEKIELNNALKEGVIL